MSEDKSNKLGFNLGNINISLNEVVSNALASKIPINITPEQLKEIQRFLTNFLESKEGKQLKEKMIEMFKNILKQASEEKDTQKSWESIRGFITDGENVTSIGSAIIPYLTANSSEIQDWILKMFK